MERIIIDCHNHTKGSRFDKSVKGSDGYNYIEDFAEIAREKKLTMCAITDHDVVNRKLKELLEDTQIIVPEAVEISAKNYNRDKSLHILYYAKTISENVDNLLSGVILQKKQMLKGQILKLNEKGFRVSFEEVYDYVIKMGNGENGINKWNITNYLFEGNNALFNKNKYLEIFGENSNYKDFYQSCMKSTGEFYEEYKVDFGRYEPEVSIIGELAKKDNAILSIAHPPVTFKNGIEEFKKEVPYYIEKGINAVEINVMSDENWVKAIMEVKEKYNLILTIGSDCHKIGGIDDKHYDFGNINPLLNQDIIKENFIKFREKIGI